MIFEGTKNQFFFGLELTRAGNGFPEVSLLIPLCSELDITVNELLSGERVSEEQYRNKAEENMVNLVKEAQENKKKIILSVMVGILTILATVPLFMVAGMFDMRTGVRITFIAIEIGRASCRERVC